jgi:polysaccharide biosynthesis transport protein
MTEQLEEQPSQSFDLDHYLGIVRRRHLHFLLPMFVGWLLVWGASWVLPARYKSGTLILVEQPTMPKDYVTPNVTDDLQERLQSITQQILSRTRLLHIIDEFDLYATERGLNNPDEKVERMRKDIDIQLVRDAQDRVTAFNVYYSSRDPRVAQQVTSELTNLFINENLEIRQRQSEGTTKFLQSQLDEARQSLNIQEQKIREFKGQHLQELPTQQASNLQILAGLQSQLHNEQDALGAAQQQHVYLQTLSDQYRNLQAPTTAGDTQLGLPAIDKELDRLKSELADLTSRYTERHPDVRKLKEQIATTKKTRDQLLADIKNRRNIPSDTNDTAPSSAISLAQATPLAQLQSQLQANEIETKNREQTAVALQRKINDYQARLNQEPMREQQLADLTRGYDQSKTNYDDLLKKKNESAMATSMELLQQGERFRIIDPPSLPLKPDFPNRLKFCGIGVAAGLAFGAIAVGAFEMMDDRLYVEKEIKELIPVAVILEIPAIVNSADEQDAKRKSFLGWATAAVVVFSILAGSAFSFLRG